MLVLTRRIGERIQLGDNISITVVRISETAVRIGIDAPTDMPVMRQELLSEGPSPGTSKTPREPAAIPS